MSRVPLLGGDVGDDENSGDYQVLTIKFAISHLSISFILLLVINVTLFLLINPLQYIFCMFTGEIIH